MVENLCLVLGCSSCTGKCWPSVVFVRTLLRSVCTATTLGQYSPVRPSPSLNKRLLFPYFFTDTDNFLLLCASGRRLCYFIPLPEASPVKVIPLRIEIDSTPVGISYDPQEKQIYWTDYSGNINRAFLNNGSKEVVVSGASYPTGVEVDVIGRNIYFADYYGNNIRVASLDGTIQAVLVDVQYPQGIALDSVAG